MTTIDPKSAQAALFEKLELLRKLRPKKPKVIHLVNRLFEINDHAITKSGSICANG